MTNSLALLARGARGRSGPALAGRAQPTSEALLVAAAPAGDAAGAGSPAAPWRDRPRHRAGRDCGCRPARLAGCRASSHATLSAAGDFAALLAWVRGRHEHVSAERLLSGIGLPLLRRPGRSERQSRPTGWAQRHRRNAAWPIPAGCAAARSTPSLRLLGETASNVALTLERARQRVHRQRHRAAAGRAFFDSRRFRERFEFRAAAQLPGRDPDGADHRHAGGAGRRHAVAVAQNLR